MPGRRRSEPVGIRVLFFEHEERVICTAAFQKPRLDPEHAQNILRVTDDSLVDEAIQLMHEYQAEFTAGSIEYVTERTEPS
jgi:hypothetical protein